MSRTDLTNCQAKEPLIKLAEGKAPELNYNIPQRSCITAHGAIPLGIPVGWFTPSTKKEPDHHWWKIDRGNPELLPEVISEVVKGKTASPLLDFGSAAVLANRAPLAGDQRSVAAPSSRYRRNTRGVEPDVKGVADLIAKGLRPVPLKTFGGKTTLEFIPKPRAATPRLYLVEEYKICSYLGDYGAGKTLNTFSLLPGEKTKITVRTYRDVTGARSTSENILDSFSQESADEIEKLVEEESGYTSGYSETKTSSTSAGGGLNVGGNISGVEIGVSGQTGHESAKSTETAREENISTLSRAMDKHIEQTSYGREIEINTSSTTTVNEGEEQSVVREIANVNHSRVLNFVFRQLLQEYVTVTYLSNVRILYTNGYLESNRWFELYTLDDVLPQLIQPARIEQVKKRILGAYCAVFNYLGQPKRFIERVERKTESCEFGRQESVFYRKDPNLTDSVDDITVPGVITKVKRYTLRTPAVVVEALLGQGEALDCYNQRLQEAAAGRAEMENTEQELGLDIVESIQEPEKRVHAYTEIFGLGVTEESDKDEEESEE